MLLKEHNSKRGTNGNSARTNFSREETSYAQAIKQTLKRSSKGNYSRMFQFLKRFQLIVNDMSFDLRPASDLTKAMDLESLSTCLKHLEQLLDESESYNARLRQVVERVKEEIRSKG